MSGAWAKGTSKAVSTPPPPPSAANNLTANPANKGGRATGGTGVGNDNGSGRNSNNTSGGGGRKDGRGGGGGRGRGRGRGSGGGSGGGGGGGRHHNNNPNHNHNHNHGKGGGGRGDGGGANPTNNRITIKDVQLLDETGVGTTPAQKAVIRINARELVRQRLQYVQPSTTFTPNPHCHWTNENRIEIIQALSSKVMELGDVSKGSNNSGNKNGNNPNNPNSKSKHDTAPPLEECQPLAIDEETRWKSKAMERKSSMVFVEGQAGASAPIDPTPTSTAEIVSRARLILNKISWTTLDKLVVQFMEITKLTENEVVRHAIIKLLVEKAQMEPHFADMYSQICAIIAKQVKTFKKELLAECQKEFEIDLDQQIAIACQGRTDPDEIEYHSLLIRKAYMGHMKFLGELYLRDVVKLSIMMYCLDELLKDETHEDSLECFAHLMTTTGDKLDEHARQNDKHFDWQKVIDLRQSTKISNRIKFLLQDLLDLRERGWVKRRKEETAKTIADIHKQVAKEEKEAKLASRRASQPNLRRSTSQPAEVDEDGFVSVPRVSFNSNKKSSGGAKPVGGPAILVKPPAQGSLRRAVSQPAMPHGGAGVDRNTNLDVDSTTTSTTGMSSLTLSTMKEAGGSAVVDSAACVKKIQSILKEYYVSGDTDDAVLSVDELVQASTSSSSAGDVSSAAVERGARVIEGATLLAMEGIPAEVPLMLQVMVRCVSEGKIPAASIVPGLADPLELLGDMEIDAPLAGKHLVLIVTECLKLNALTMDFLVKESPEEFRRGGRAASFACQVLRQRGTDPSEDDWQVIASLMTPDEDKEFESARAMWEAKK